MIGVFDSGAGGLCALRTLLMAYPEEEIVYFGDTARLPYGTRSAQIILQYAEEDLAFLLSFHPRAILAACGTVSTIALPTLQPQTQVPLFGVAKSAAQAAANASKNGKIGVIGTQATIQSNRYTEYLQEINPHLTVYAAACPLFVPLVESGFPAKDPITAAICAHYLAPLKAAEIDTLILGCTHYPLLNDAIAPQLPGVTLIDVGTEAVRTMRTVLPPLAEKTPSDISLCAERRVRFYVSDHPSAFSALAESFFGWHITATIHPVYSTIGA